MKRNHQELDVKLDQLAEAIRLESPAEQTINESAERVWARLASQAEVAPIIETAPAERIRSCADFQSLIPVYLHGELSDARALLLEDHTHECIPCRKALKEARNGARTLATKAKRANLSTQRKHVPAVWRWSIAAGLLLCIGIAASVFTHRFSPFGEAIAANVESANGTVFRVSESDSRTITAGEAIKRGETIRTAKDSGAMVRLADGSLIEMRERSEFSLSDSVQGTTIHLERGDIIVQAAKQHAKHLYVATPDSLVSVTGTIFSVNSGTKGSRVSVVEGEVHVNHSGTEDVLHPGEQAATQPTLERVPVAEEVAWSRNADLYAKELAQVASLRKELNERVPHPGVRYSTRFLDMVPDNTVLYAALPNLSATLSESHRIMQERIAQNPALREWWSEREKSGQHVAGPNQMIEKVRAFGEYLGDEIVLSAGLDERGEPGSLLVLGELKNAQGFRPFLERQVKELGAEAKNSPNVHVIDDPLAQSTATATDAKPANELYIWIHEDFFAASPKLEQLRQLETTINTPTTNRFAGTPFYTRISEIYREGAGLIVAADLEKIVQQRIQEEAKTPEGAKRLETYRQLGLLNLKHFVVEQKEGEGKTQSRAILTFNEPRRGIASWLAAPAPMGSLQYVSPDANVATAFVVKEPALLVDDLLGFMDTVSPDLRKHLQDLEAQHGLDVKRDLAAPLGGEFAFAVDGPLAPTPSWKMVVEVYDQARLQQTFEHVIDELNRWAATQHRGGLQWEQTQSGGRTFYTLRSVDFSGVEVNYTYANGYLIVAPSRALIERAIQYHDSGYTLLHAPQFTASLPEDGHTNFSAVFYYNLGAMLAPVAEHFAESKNMTDEQRQSLKSLTGDLRPTLAYAYAQGDRITIASNTEGGPFGLGAARLLGAPSDFDIQHILMNCMGSKNAEKH